MSQTTKTDVSTAIPVIFLQEILNQFREWTWTSNLVLRNTSLEQNQAGDTVTVNFAPKATARTLASDGSDYTFDTQTPTKKDIVLGLPRYYGFEMTNLAETLALPALRKSFVVEATNALLTKFESDVLAEYANATNEVGSAGTLLDTDDFIDARKKLVDNNMPRGARASAIISTKDAAALIKELKNASTSGSTDALRLGAIGQIGGLYVYESQLIPTAGSPTETHNLVMADGSIGVAFRNFKQPEEGTGVKQVTVQSEDGYSVTMTSSWNPIKQSMYHMVKMLYGIKSLRPEVMCDLIS